MLRVKVKKLESWKEKAIGLAGAEKACPVFFRTRWGIHTFGVGFPIDVLILDSADRVVRAVSALPPGRIYFWPPVYDRVLELPAGEISTRQIKIGSKIRLTIFTK